MSLSHFLSLWTRGFAFPITIHTNCLVFNQKKYKAFGKISLNKEYSPYIKTGKLFLRTDVHQLTYLQTVVWCICKSNIMFKVILVQTCFPAHLKLKPVFLIETHWYSRKHVWNLIYQTLSWSDNDTAAGVIFRCRSARAISSAHKLCALSKLLWELENDKCVQLQPTPEVNALAFELR